MSGTSLKSSVLLLFLLAVSIQAQHTGSLAKGITQYIDLFNTSMNDAVACYRIPALVTTPNGTLLAAIDERISSCNDLRSNNDINIVLRSSSDNGKTWSPIKTVVDFPWGKSASDPSMIVDQITNDIFLFYNYMDLLKQKDVYYLHVIKSSDNGKTWSPPTDITDQISKPQWHNDFKFITSGRGIQTKKGNLLHTLVNLKNGLHLFGSNDHGKTWYTINTPILPADESKVIERADGSLMINARVNATGMRYVHISNDEGKTWQTKPAPHLADPGCNASIIRYTAVSEGFDKNRLLFSNANSKKDRVNLTVKISYDEGKTWSASKTIYSGPSAYSSLTILQNGDIGLFFEQDEYSKNPFVSFSLQWLTDKKDTYKKTK